jgi:predicted flap endonuclease-1-like 5' DNA nuclease
VELRKFQSEREQLLARLAEREARVRELEGASPEELERARERIRDLESQLARLRQRLETAETERDFARKEAREIESRRDPGELRVASAPDEDRETLKAELAVRDAKIARLERELSESLAWATSVPSDDLKRIAGIGPKYEKALHAAGIRSVVTIAAWSESDASKIAQTLNTQKSRIDKWIAAAKKLPAER